MKKLISGLLALVMVLSLAAVPAYADETPSGTPINSSTASFALESGSYYLAGNVTLTETTSVKIESGNEVTIDLNGYTLTGNGAAVIQVGGTLTLVDSSTGQTGIITGGSAAKGGGVYVNGGTFTMNGGTISGNTATDGTALQNGGNVYLNSGTFNMNGGTITGGSAAKGGGVYVNGGSFTMAGGTISGNTAQHGAGVYFNSSSGTFTMAGGTISGNTATSTDNSYNGGGVYMAAGTFSMTAGEISGNTAKKGAGVYLTGSSSTFTMTGGAITGNTSSGNDCGAAGVEVNGGTFTLNGGTISINTSGKNGGGVRVMGGTFNMESGIVSGNTASDMGGGIYADAGTVTLSGGTISGNTATTTSGGGVHVDEGVTFTMTGGTITNNKAGTTGGGIHFEAKDGAAVTITDGSIYENTAQENMGQDVAIEVSSGDTATLTINSAVNSGMPGWTTVGMWYEEQTEANIDMTVTKTAGSAPYTNGLYLTAPVGNAVAQFYTRTLTLDGDVGVNYYVDMTDIEENDRNNYTVVFTGSGISCTADYNSESYRDDWNGTKYYRFTVTVDSTQMATSFIAELKYKGETIQTDTYSVERYCKWAITNNKAEKDLCAALLNYGGYSQTYFGSTGTLANANLSTYFNTAGGTWTDPVVDEFTADLSDYTVDISTDMPSEITANSFSASLVLESQTVIRIYFNASGTDNLTFTVGEETLEIQSATSGNYAYYVEYEVQASKLGTPIVFTITNTSGTTGTVSYSAYAYINTQLTSTTAATDALKNVCMAMYYYGQEAIAYNNWYKGTT